MCREKEEKGKEKVQEMVQEEMVQEKVQEGKEMVQGEGAGEGAGGEGEVDVVVVVVNGITSAVVVGSSGRQSTKILSPRRNRSLAFFSVCRIPSQY
jgi:hypothetical protein